MSISINGKTPVQLTVQQLLGSAITILVVGIGAFWALASWTSAGLRDDVSEIRRTLGTLQGSDKDNALNIKQAEVNFTKQVSDLNVTLATFGGKMDAFGQQMEGMSKSLDQAASQIVEVQKKMVADRPPGLDPKSLAEALRSAGVDAKTIVVVPYESNPPATPR